MYLLISCSSNISVRDSVFLGDNITEQFQNAIILEKMNPPHFVTNLSDDGQFISAKKMRSLPFL